MSDAASRASALARLRRVADIATDPPDLLARAGPLVSAAVPSDVQHWQLYDPEAMLPICNVSSTSTPWHESLLHCELEQAVGDVNAFRDLARRRLPVATLTQATGGEPASSRRYRELLAPAGISYEARAALIHRGSCWGTYTALRQAGPDFGSTDVKWLTAAGRAIARGVARTLRDHRPPADAPGPGVFRIGSAAAPVALNPAGVEWLDILTQPPWGRQPLDVALRAVATRVTGDRGGTSVQSRVPTAAGWALVTGSVLEGSSTATVVIDGARGSQVLPVLSRAYGLTRQEQAVVSLVMQGLSTKEISAQLRITTDTVGDHLKAVFGKTETNSRGRLRHRLALDAWDTGPDTR